MKPQGGFHVEVDPSVAGFNNEEISSISSAASPTSDVELICFLQTPGRKNWIAFE
jgi:hypothetical protein